jgi:hypothetical protein
LAGTGQIKTHEEATVSRGLFYPVIGTIIGAEIAVFGWILYTDAEGHDSKLHAVCDNAVKQLLHSHDLTEITRARALIHEIPCKVWQRIRDDEKEAP